METAGEIIRDIEILEDQIALARVTNCDSIAVPIERPERLLSKLAEPQDI